jgi:hypothetical protein
VLFLAGPLGQEFRATINGRVTDARGAAAVINAATPTRSDETYTVSCKTFLIAAPYRAQFRLETYNTLNTPMFAAVNTDPNSPPFGHVRPSDTSFPRHIQFGFKFMS